jgi:hypothetical protein
MGQKMLFMDDQQLSAVVSVFIISGMHIKLYRMGVGPQEHLDIIDKTFKKCVKKGLKRAFLEPKTHF